MPKSRLIGEFFEYVKSNKKLWLIPLLVILGIFGLVIIVAQSQAVLTAVYALF